MMEQVYGGGGSILSLQKFHGNMFFFLHFLFFFTSRLPLLNSVRTYFLSVGYVMIVLTIQDFEIETT